MDLGAIQLFMSSKRDDINNTVLERIENPFSEQ